MTLCSIQFKKKNFLIYKTDQFIYNWKIFINWFIEIIEYYFNI